MSQFSIRRILISVVFLALGNAACAHTGAAAAALFHPPAWDHLLVMVGVGLWASAARSKSTVWHGPLVFLLVLALTLWASLNSHYAPIIEPAVALTLFLLGGLLLLGHGRVPPAAALSVIAVVGAVHGWAHGSEAPIDHGGTYVLGVLLTSATVQALGIAVGGTVQHLRRQHWAWRTLGAGFGVVGLLSLVSR